MTTRKVTGPPQYAVKTEVPIERSKGEIEKLLQRHGAVSFAYGYDANREILSFEMEDRRFRFEFPPLLEESFAYHDSGRKRSITDRQLALEQAKRTRWRELHLGIKAKLVMVSAGITTMEEEFFAHVVLQDGRTMHQWSKPYLKQTYLSAHMPPLLPGIEKGDES